MRHVKRMTRQYQKRWDQWMAPVTRTEPARSRANQNGMLPGWWYSTEVEFVESVTRELGRDWQVWR